jgi:phytoene dehydrogenase-like protein
MNKYDAAVIGGGITGLTASIYLRKAGLSVIVLEKSELLGGRAMTVKKNHALLNLGVHALYLDGEAEQILKELNIHLKGACPPASAIAVWNKRSFPFPAGPLALMSSKLFGFAGKLDLAKVMIKLPKTDPRQMDNISMREWVEKEIRDPLVRHAIYAVSRSNTFVPHPDLLSAGPAIRQLQRTLSGKAFYVERGWGALVEHLEEIALQTGVAIATRKHVVEIAHNGKVCGVRLKNDETIQVSNVIVAGGPGDGYGLVPNAEHTSMAKWKNQARPIKAACLDVVLRKLPKPKPSFIAGFWLDQPIFYNNPSSVVNMSSDGSVVIHMIKHLGMHPGEPREDERQLEQALDMVQPGWRQEELARQFLPAMTVTHHFPTVDSADYCCGPDVPEIRGLYVAGDWTGRGEMLADAALASAKRAAGAVIREHNRTSS